MGEGEVICHLSFSFLTLLENGKKFFSYFSVFGFNLLTNFSKNLELIE